VDLGIVKVTEYNAPGYAWVIASVVGTLLVFVYFHNARTDIPPPPAPATPAQLAHSASMPIVSGHHDDPTSSHLSRHHPHSRSTPAVGVVAERPKRTLFADDDDELEGGDYDPPPHGGTGDMSRFPPSASFSSPGRDSPISRHSSKNSRHSSHASIVRPRSVSESGMLEMIAPMHQPCGPLGLSVNAYICLILQFVGTVCYITMETILPPVVDKEYGFGVLANGITWTGAAVVGVFSYLSLQWLSKRGWSDSFLLINAQILFTAGNIFFCGWPWSGTTSPEFHPDRIPDLPHWRLGVGLFLAVLGFTQCDAISMSMYSKSLAGQDDEGGIASADRRSTVTADGKVIEPPKNDHGSSMGIVLSTQALGCMVGPVAGSHGFDAIGREVFLCCAGLMLFAVLLAIMTRHRFARTSSDHYAAAEIGDDEDYEVAIAAAVATQQATDYHAQVTRASGYGAAAIAAATSNHIQHQYRHQHPVISGGHGNDYVAVDGGLHAAMPAPPVVVPVQHSRATTTGGSSSLPRAHAYSNGNGVARSAPSSTTPLLDVVGGNENNNRITSRSNHNSNGSSNGNNKKRSTKVTTSTPPRSTGRVIGTGSNNSPRNSNKSNKASSSSNDNTIRVSLPSPSSRRAIEASGTMSQPQSLSSSPVVPVLMPDPIITNAGSAPSSSSSSATNRTSPRSPHSGGNTSPNNINNSSGARGTSRHHRTPSSKT
jgi:hypothetical protein